MFFFVKKKLLSPTLYTRRLFSDGTDIDGGGVLPILRNNEMVKLDKRSTDVGVQWTLILILIPVNTSLLILKPTLSCPTTPGWIVVTRMIPVTTARTVVPM